MKKVITFVITLLLISSLILFSASADDSNQRKWKKRFMTLSQEELNDAYLAILSFINSEPAGSDLSSMSYEDLVRLRDQINLAMWNSEEWQEVTVPIGVWTVGEDIPVGHWSISLSPDASGKWASIKYCDRLDASGTDAGNQFYCDIYAYLDVASPDNDKYPQKIDLDLKPGTYIIIGHGSVVFTPYSGKPDLGFK